MRYTYYGHSCFSLETGGKHLLFDPYISDNGLASSIDIDAIEADNILISHAHFDHMADAERIATRTGATIISNWEIYEYFSKKGFASVFPMNTGGKAEFDFGILKCVVAQHSSSFADGKYGGNPIGFVIKSDDCNIYYSGDTALTLDMQLIPSFAVLKYAILPIGDVITMGMEDAMRAAHMLSCHKVIGLHYNTWPNIRIETEKATALFVRNGLELLLPEIGSSLDL